MKSKLRMAGIALLAVVGLWSCNDSPTEPEPNNGRSTGRAYVANPGGRDGIDVIDLETDSVIHSLQFGNERGGVSVKLTADNRFLLASVEDGVFRVFDARDMSVVQTGPTFGSFEPVKGDSAILGQFSKSFTLFSFRDLDTILHREANVRPISFNYSARERVAYTLRGGDTLVAVSVDSLAVVDEWVIRSSGESEFYLNSSSISHDDRFAYFTAYGPVSAVFVTYNLQTRQIVATHPINGPFGRIAVSPNGKEVWVTDPFPAGTSFVSEGIWVFDGRTGQYLRTVSLRGYLPSDSTEPLIARAIQFAADGRNVIVGTGDFTSQRGTVLRISTITNKVEKIYFPHFDRLPYDIAVGEKP